jgi:hypothetical protein
MHKFMARSRCRKESDEIALCVTIKYINIISR